MSPINASALALLRRALSPSASVHLPGDAGYSTKRWALNAEKPAAIVACPATVEDVAHVLAFAQSKAPYDTQPALPFAVKCGGHSFLGASSSEGGMVLDLNPNMHNVRVDAQAKLAYVGGGCLWEDVITATLKEGLACVTGVCPFVGVGGSTLGGGFGWLTGQHGLTIDNLVGATVVTSSGDILTASESTNSDLFWAIRGGGGNFGVVTEFVIALHEQRADVYTSALTFAPSTIEKLVPELNAWLVERETTENAHLMFALGANGQPEIVLQLVYNGDSATGAQKFERFVNLGPSANKSETTPYAKLSQLQDPYVAQYTNRIMHGNFIPATPAGIPATFINEAFGAWTEFVAENTAAAESVMAIELYHPDKWASVPADKTAYVHRKPTFNVAYIMSWSDSAFTPSAWSKTVALDEAVTQLRTEHFSTQEGGAYTNYVGDESKFTARQFGENIDRLQKVKAKYDPAGAFGRWFAVSEKSDAVLPTVERVQLACAY